MNKFRIQLTQIKILGLNWYKCNIFRTFFGNFPSRLLKIQTRAHDVQHHFQIHKLVMSRKHDALKLLE